MLAPEDPRRPAVKVANPLSEDQPQLRTTLLPGLFRTLVRNIGRGFADTAPVRDRPGVPAAPGRARRRADPRHRPGADRGGARDARRRAARPAAAGGRRPRGQPRAARLVGPGTRRRPGPTRSRRPARWRAVSHLAFDVRAAAEAPWHPGRCAALYVRRGRGRRPSGGRSTSGWRARGRAAPAGDRRVRAAAADQRVRARLRRARGRRRGGRARCAARRCPPTRSPRRTSRSWWREEVPAAEVAAALTAGAGELLEDVRLFDVYTGAQLGAGPQVAGVHAAAARPRPDPHRRRGDGRPRRRGGRGRPPHGRGAAPVQ